MSARSLLPVLRAGPRAARPADWARLGAASPEVVAFHHPDYRGVTQSTRTLLGAHEHGHCMALGEGDVASPARLEAMVAAVEASGARCVVFSGFADGYAGAIHALARALPKLAIRVLWHGSALQNVEDCNWEPLQQILALAREGVVERVGFLKRGMAEVVARTGVDAHWLCNFVERIPQHAGAVPSDGRWHLGVWNAGSSWRKNPHAMLSAASLVDGAVVSGVLDDRARAWCRTLGVALGRVHREPLEHRALLHRLGGLHCNLYVTLSECSPLLPLESLSQGAPCLVSATSHLFEGSESLSRLVVSRLDDPLAIAGALRDACARRDEIVEAYRGWAPGYNARAREAARRFLATA